MLHHVPQGSNTRLSQICGCWLTRQQRTRSRHRPSPDEHNAHIYSECILPIHSGINTFLTCDVRFSVQPATAKNRCYSQMAGSQWPVADAIASHDKLIATMEILQKTLGALLRAGSNCTWWSGSCSWPHFTAQLALSLACLAHITVCQLRIGTSFRATLIIMC